jgi:hypothetical protein
MAFMDVDLNPSSVRVRLVNHQIRPLKEMPSFQKQHRVPATAKEGKGFLNSLARDQIQSDLDEKFSALRNGFGFKRREMSVADPYEGCGSIETPFFNYEFSVDFLDQDPTKVCLQRTIKDIRETTSLLNPVFSQIFGNQFNTLELRFSEPLNLEAIVDAVEDLDSDQIIVQYDKDLTWCELHFADASRSVRLEGKLLSIASPMNSTSPADLLRMLADVQQRISHLLRFEAAEIANRLP